MNLYNENMVIIDLDRQETQTRELDLDLVQERIGGAALNQALYQQVSAQEPESDPIIIGTGPLTGTPIPGAGLSVITAKSPVTGQLAHVPILQWIGSEIKYSGFDFIVIKGQAENPVYLWLHDGLADIADAGAIKDQDTWQTTDWIRRQRGDNLIQVISTGSAAANQSPNAQLVLNYWPSADHVGMAKLLGEKKIKAIAFRGLGIIDAENGESLIEEAIQLKDRIRKEVVRRKAGVGSLGPDLGCPDLAGWLKPLVHRNRSCFACPFPCLSFVKYNESPRMIAESEVAEPGLLLTNPQVVAAFYRTGLEVETAMRSLEVCARLGVDPLSAAAALEQNRPQNLEQAKAVIGNLAAASDRADAPLVGADASPFSPWMPNAVTFSVNEGQADAAAAAGDDGKLRNALGYTLGICPLLLLAVPFLDQAALANLLSLGGGEEIDSEKLEEVVGLCLD